MNNLSLGKLRLTLIAPATFTITAGAAGWIDTNCSATVGTNTERLWLITINGAGAQNAGARAHGETVEPIFAAYCTTFFTRCDSTGHIDLYRNAGNDENYIFLGYFE